MKQADIKAVHQAAGHLLKTIQEFLGDRCVVAFGVIEDHEGQERMLASEWHSGKLKPGDVEKLALNIAGTFCNLVNKNRREI